MYEYKTVKVSPEEFHLATEAIIPGYAKQGWRLVQIMQPLMMPKRYITVLGFPILPVQYAWGKPPQDAQFVIVLERALTD